MDSSEITNVSYVRVGSVFIKGAKIERRQEHEELARKVLDGINAHYASDVPNGITVVVDDIKAVSLAAYELLDKLSQEE